MKAGFDIYFRERQKQCKRIRERAGATLCPLISYHFLTACSGNLFRSGRRVHAQSCLVAPTAGIASTPRRGAFPLSSGSAADAALQVTHAERRVIRCQRCVHRALLALCREDSEPQVYSDARRDTSVLSFGEREDKETAADCVLKQLLK